MKYLVVAFVAVAAFLSSVAPGLAADGGTSVRKTVAKIERLGGLVTLEESPSGQRIVAVEFGGRT